MGRVQGKHPSHCTLSLSLALSDEFKSQECREYGQLLSEEGNRLSFLCGFLCWSVGGALLGFQNLYPG